MIALILSIPFYITSVYARIDSISARGSDGVDGYAKQNDYINVNVRVSIPDDTITTNHLFVGSDLQFNKCTPSINNGSDCTLRIPANGTEFFDPVSTPYTISLFKDDGALDDSRAGNFTIDNKAPQVYLSIPQTKFTSQQNVVVKYEATDYACDDPSCSGKCVGIKEIEFFTLDGAFKQKISELSGCSSKSSITIDSNIFNDGSNSVFAKAVDKFNQVSQEASVTFEIDNVGPSILANTFAIISKGISISTFSSAKIPVEVVVNISAKDLNLNGVTADLSALNPLIKNAKASCVSGQQNMNACRWFIELNPGTGGLKHMVINATDLSNNRQSITVSKLLSLEEKGPVLESLYTNTEYQEQLLAKSTGNTLTAVFDEST